MPGMITRNGTTILAKVPMIGAERAAVIESAAIARCTSTKFVVQYPKDKTKPSPKTMPKADNAGELKPDSSRPGQECSWFSGWA